jgi:hypothetical protein
MGPLSFLSKHQGTGNMLLTELDLGLDHAARGSNIPASVPLFFFYTILIYFQIFVFIFPTIGLSSLSKRGTPALAFMGKREMNV